MIGAIDHDLIAEKLSAITQLSRKDLVERWTSTNKRPPPKGISRRILEYSAAYQVQVKACGGLSPKPKVLGVENRVQRRFAKSRLNGHQRRSPRIIFKRYLC